MSQAVVAISTTTQLLSCGPKPKAQPKKKNPKTVAVGGGGFGGKRKDPTWQCIQGCGACCKLDKGPSFPTPEEIFDESSDIELYKSMIGPDGWCIHFEKSARTCAIYSERPYFCRVEPAVFERLYGVDEKRFNKEACSCCTDMIKSVYGARSQELETFKQATRASISS